MKKLKMGMVGGGIGAFIGEVHRKAARMDGGVEFVAGAFDIDPEKSLEQGRILGVDPKRTYRTYDEMIKAELALPKGERVDFISICTPNHTHFPIAKACLEAGFNVMCEKPMTLTVEQALELDALVKKTKLTFGLMHTYTGYPMVKLARDLVRKGELGKVDKVVLEYVQGSFRKVDFSKPLDRHNAWKMNPKISGPSCVVADIGVHAFTMVEYVTGLEAKTLLADLSSFAPGNKLDDDASILMRLGSAKGGARGASAKASLVVSKIATGEENGVRLRVYGDKASLHWDQEAPNYLTLKYPLQPDRVFRRKAPYVADLSPASVKASRFPAGHHEGFVEALATIYDEFVAAVLTRRACDYPGPREGVRSMRFVEAALASNAKGSAWVRV